MKQDGFGNLRGFDMHERSKKMSKSLNRRTLLKAAAGSSAALVAGNRLGSSRATAADTTPTPAPTPTPVSLGEGDTSITMWVQDFGPAIDYFKKAAEVYIGSGANVKVTVQAISFDDLLAKMLPSIAAGTEADIIMGYTDWYVATDVSRLFLPLDEYMGGKAELEKSLFPSTLTTLDLPKDKVYYVPFAAGIRAAATTVNVKQFKEAGVDYLTFGAWDDVVTAGQKLTTKDGDKITRAGLSPVTAILSLVKTWIWQMDGEFYDHESGKWSLSSPEGEAAMQRLYDLYWGTTPTSSFDLVTFDNEYTSFEQGRSAADLNGAWAVGVHEANVEGLEADAVPTPKLAEAKTDVVYPEHLGVATLSRRLAKNDKKREHCVGIIKQMFKPESLLGMTETYSGTLCSKELYADPRIMETKYGPVSKRFAEGTWPRTRYPKDHVANQAPARTELERALRKEISIKEALGNADKYLNDQEKQARERLG
jgi:ABC-type glycerol-3-phosphate transport system substrate-binding protein